MRIVTDFEAGCEAAVHFTSPSPLQFDSTPVTLVIDWGRPATWTANVGRNQSCLPEFLFLIYCKGSLKSIQKLWLHTICLTPLFENQLTFPLWKLQKQDQLYVRCNNIKQCSSVWWNDSYWRSETFKNPVVNSLQEPGHPHSLTSDQIRSQICKISELLR